jgi:hypothetical protein
VKKARTWGMHGNVGHACGACTVTGGRARPWGHVRQGGVHAATGGARLSLGAQTGGVHGSKEEGIYVLPSSFEVAKPSSPGSLQPAKCFAWDFGG